MTVESRLAAIQARADAATEGPWSVYRGDRIGTYVTRPDLAGVAREWSLTWSDADAEFIAASRTDLPTLLAAVEAVMARHSAEPARYYGTDLNPNNPYDCRACGEGRAWPCPTVRDITAALGVQG